MVFKKIIFQNSLMANETPSRPPPLHGKCHLKFPFWFSAHLPKQPSWWDTNLLFGMKSIISDLHCAGILGWSNSGRSRRRPDLPTSACCKWHLRKCFWLTTIDCRHQKKSLRRESTVPLRWRTKTWPKQQQIRLLDSIQIPHPTSTTNN